MGTYSGYNTNTKKQEVVASIPTTKLTTMSTMESIIKFLEPVSDLFVPVLNKLISHPSQYMFLFPNDMDMDRVNKMIAEGIFPVASGLAPALTFAIVLSVLRFLLHHLVFKVWYFL